jgi:hypothetical protein
LLRLATAIDHVVDNLARFTGIPQSLQEALQIPEKNPGRWSLLHNLSIVITKNEYSAPQNPITVRHARTALDR